MTLEHHEVRAILPQRYPLLLVDRVVDFRSGEEIRTVKAVTGTEPCYAALPDGADLWRYRYPQSLVVESLGQSAALLWLWDHEVDPGDGQVLMFAGARTWSFDGFAYPGDVIHHHVRLSSVIADTAFASGETWVGERRIAHVETVIATRRPVRGSVPSPDTGLAAAGDVRATEVVASSGRAVR